MGRAFNDGLGRLGGREKGTPNRKSQTIESLIDLDEINLPGEILNCCESLEPLEKAQIMLKLMEYIYPKRKAIAHELKDDEKNKGAKITFVEIGSREDLARHNRLQELEAKERERESQNHNE